LTFCVEFIPLPCLLACLHLIGNVNAGLLVSLLALGDFILSSFSATISKAEVSFVRIKWKKHLMLFIQKASRNTNSSHKGEKNSFFQNRTKKVSNLLDK
jgi:hypothetical protein